MTSVAKLMMGGASGGGGGNVTCRFNNIGCTAIPCTINGCTDLSYGGWVRNCGMYANMPSWQEGSGGWGGTYFGLNGATMECRFGSGSSNTKKQWNWVESGSDTWYHYYFVRSRSTMYFYVNGTLQGTQSSGTGALRNNKNEFTLTVGLNGGRIGWDGGAYSKQVSVVGLAFFSRALSQQEIVAARDLVKADLLTAPYNDRCLLAVNCDEGSGNRIKELVSGTDIVLESEPPWDVPMPTPS